MSYGSKYWKNIPEYDKSTFQQFSLTCRNFCRISRPFVFAELSFTVYRLGGNGAVLLPCRSKVGLLLERINFLSSTNIAPFVRFCDIGAVRLWQSGTKWSFSTDSSYILLDALFERLVCFTGLQRLNAHQIHFTQARLDVLCRLPLSELAIIWCTVAPGERIVPSPQALRVSRFRLVHDNRLEGDNDHHFSIQITSTHSAPDSIFALWAKQYTPSRLSQKCIH
jgi:hypothetical protein